MTNQLFLPGFLPEPVPSSLRLPRNGPETPQLAHFPDVAASVLSTNAKELAIAAERFVDSTVFRYGFRTVDVGENEPFDRLLFGWSMVVPTQIKAKVRPNAAGNYVFHIIRGSARNKSGRARYDPDDFELLALVILPKNVVFFTASKERSIAIPARMVPVLAAAPQVSLFHAVAEIRQRRLRAEAVAATVPALKMIGGL